MPAASWIDAGRSRYASRRRYSAKYDASILATSITPSSRWKSGTQVSLRSTEEMGRPRLLPLHRWMPRVTPVTPSKHAVTMSATWSTVSRPSLMATP